MWPSWVHYRSKSNQLDYCKLFEVTHCDQLVDLFKYALNIAYNGYTRNHCWFCLMTQAECMPNSGISLIKVKRPKANRKCIFFVNRCIDRPKQLLASCPASLWNLHTIHLTNHARCKVMLLYHVCLLFRIMCNELDNWDTRDHLIHFKINFLKEQVSWCKCVLRRPTKLLHSWVSSAGQS